jgi:hypothetical protein
MNDADLARNYILDRLSDEDRDECERRFLFDPEFELEMQEQERILLDDYVHNRLSREDSDLVLRRVAQQPGQLFRLRFAEGLKRAAAVSGSARQSKPSPLFSWHALFGQRRQYMWLGGLASIAAVAAIVVLAVATWRPAHQSSSPSGQMTGRGAAPQPAAPAAQTAVQQQPSQVTAHNDKNPERNALKTSSVSMATLVLLAEQQRGETEVPSLVLQPGVREVRLQLTTEEGLDAGRYDAAVSGAQGAKVFSASRLVPRVAAGRRYIELNLPAAAIAGGDYAIDLAPQRASGTEPILNYRFSVSFASPARIPEEKK